MAYNDFTIDAVKQQFGLRTDTRGDFFAAIAPHPVSDFLRQTLSLNLPLALALSNEKARSELLIMPILLEVYRQTQQTFSLFTGVEFNVDVSKGLAGFCDYLLSLSVEQLIVEAPVVAIVEAKKDNINSGIGQCLAEMLAAQTFNARRGNRIPTIYGVITTGTNWKFLRLVGDTAFIDRDEYYIDHVERLVAILIFMVTPPTPSFVLPPPPAPAL